MAKQQDDSASEDWQQNAATPSVSSSSLASHEHVDDDDEGHTDWCEPVASGVDEYAQSNRCTTTLPFHLFSACGNGRSMSPSSKTITSRDLSRGIKKMAVKGMFS